MYSCIDELPSNVKSALTSDEQALWLKTYNETNSVDKAWNSVEAAARTFEFFANAEIIDLQGELVKSDALLEAMPAYIKTGGPVIDTHSNRIVGTVYRYEPAVTPAGHKAVKCKAAIWKGQRVYDAVWHDIQSGKKPAVSIGGDKLQENIQCSKYGCHNEISKLHLYEISPVLRPANPESSIIAVNAAAKSVLDGPGEPGKERDTMSEDNATAQAPPGGMKKEDAPGGEYDELKELVAQVLEGQNATNARLDALEEKVNGKNETDQIAAEEGEDEADQIAAEDPEEDPEKKEEPKACGCNKSVDPIEEVLKLRKDLENGKYLKGETDPPGTATPGQVIKTVKSEDLKNMSIEEINAFFTKGE